MKENTETVWDQGKFRKTIHFSALECKHNVSCLGSEAETWKFNVRGKLTCPAVSCLLPCSVGIWGKFSIISSSNWMLDFGPGPSKSVSFPFLTYVTLPYHSHSVKTAASIVLVPIKMFLKSKFTRNWREMRDKALLNLFSCWWVVIVCS